MKNQFIDQKTFNNLEVSMQKFMEINVKMMQNLSSNLANIKPMDLLSVKKPEDILEKQIELFIKNSNMVLDYMRATFNILENHWLNVSRNFDQNTQKIFHEVPVVAKKSIKKATTSAKSTAKKVATATNKAVSTAKKSASSTSTNTKKEAKTAKSDKTHTAKTAKKEAKSTPQTQSKSSIIHAKEPISQNTPNTSTDKNMSNVSKVAEKSGAKDLGIQNVSKSNFPH